MFWHSGLKLLWSSDEHVTTLWGQAKLRPKRLRSRDPGRNLRRQKDSYIPAAIGCHCKRAKRFVMGLITELSRQWMARFKLYRILGLQPRDKADMLGVNTIEFLCRRIYTKMEFSSQRRKMLLFLTTNMATVTSRANQQTIRSDNEDTNENVAEKLTFFYRPLKLLRPYTKSPSYLKVGEVR